MMIEKQVVATLDHAIVALKRAAQTDQQVTHSKHFCEYYQRALNELESKMVREKSRLLRLATIGR